MIYLADNWPAKYRNTLFTCNVHGNRINNDVLRRRGSGFVAEHGDDFMMANDTWFRGLELKYGPDGGVFVTDWSDTDECHDYKDIHRENGRIYKITYKPTSAAPVNIASLSDEELVKLQLHSNDWHVRHASRVLQERAAAGKLAGNTRDLLQSQLAKQTDAPKMLRTLWALHNTGGIEAKQTLDLLDSKHDYVRGWAIQLELEDGNVLPAILNRLAKLAKSDPSPVVRRYLASGLQRLPLAKRWSIAEALVAHGEDTDDAYLPLMIWYGIEPLVPADKNRALALVVKAKIPLIREYIARRIASISN